jgi:hypothetical protein
VRQGDLNVKGHGDDVGDQDERDACRPVRKGPPYKAVAEPEPVKGDEGELGRTYPGRNATPAFGRGQEVMDREYVQVESGYTHHRIVGEFLVLDGDVGEGVPYKSEVVVRRV